jgi:hypothetical protein
MLSFNDRVRMTSAYPNRDVYMNQTGRIITLYSKECFPYPYGVEMDDNTLINGEKIIQPCLFLEGDIEKE